MTRQKEKLEKLRERVLRNANGIDPRGERRSYDNLVSKVRSGWSLQRSC
jgi:hypothetical protein